MFTIIIPVFNEEKIIEENAVRFQRLSRSAEIIFVDGGSCDNSVKIALHYGRVINSEKGRARQMNTALRYAKGDILIFLHADTYILEESLGVIKKKMEEKNIIGGCFTQRINKTGFIYRCIENLGNIRALFTKVFYGDQGIFVRRDTFCKMNGFEDVPVMEDVIFTRRLRKTGKTVVLPEKIFVSCRRWQRQGIIKAAVIYSLVNILFWLRFPLNNIKFIYDDLR